ncbi:MAG: biotin carboxylase N-terminal domain-containing protein [Acidimicrobiales bacterium]|nr:biotin carboxylase N-terminal domain-containing protein [Acidimicrobiales bacterium]
MNHTSNVPITGVLVANRGEIASRVFRTARSMGMRCVAVYVDADATAPYVAEADVAVRLDDGGYLDGDALVAAAKAAGADAVHPGYGFLAEDAAFAIAVSDAGLTWIGPTPDVIASMGDKISAKVTAVAAGVPTLPSSDDPTNDEAVGYPLLVKAAAGGGGKGMHLVERPEDLTDAVATAQREAVASFGDDRVFLERYVAHSRHIEIQILGDAHGNLVHLGERECSIQRRHQKVVEESPAAVLDADDRNAMGAAARQLADGIGYRSAGTVEFLVDDASGEFFFLEVNTRLQVEHAVTEEVTGIDLVREQLRIAAGEPLGYGQNDVTFDGHAIEVRLYAEDPSAGFLPATGTLEAWEPADEPAVRWDTGVTAGSVVGVDFDPMLAKVVAHGPTRAEAAGRLALALERMHLGGVTTNRDFLAATLRHEAFLAGDTTTDFIERHTPATTMVHDGPTADRVATTAALWIQGRNRTNALVQGQAPSGWRNARLPDQAVTLARVGSEDAPTAVRYRSERDGTFSVSITQPDSRSDDDSVRHQATIYAWSANGIDLAVDGIRTTALITAVTADELAGRGEVLHVTMANTTTSLETVPRFNLPGTEAPTGGLTAPMPGKVLDVLAAAGDVVIAGQAMVVLEAMKMEHRMTAPFDGTVAEVRVTAGDQVDNGAVLMVIEPADGHPMGEDGADG